MRKSGWTFLRIAGLMLPALFFLAPPVRGDICGDSGADLAFSGGGVVNTYYPPGANGTIDPTTTTLSLGTSTGAGATLKFGAMLIVMQMQDAEFNSQDDNHYGDGFQESPADPVLDPGSGSIRINSTGLYEYVIVDDGVTAFGTTVPSLASVPIKGGGPNGRLINTYTNAASTASRGQRRYQVIRVPQYTTLTLNSALTAGAWDGKTGGVLAVDVRDKLVLNNAIVSVSGLGFRAGLGEKLSSGTPLPNTTYRQTTAISAFGNKGEGIAGTPKNMSGFPVNPEGEGYPNGSRARGAPGNAGGGGNPQEPSTNTDSSGGGGGGNGGSGGKAGETGNGLVAIGGFGGSAFVFDGTTTAAWGAGRIIMGGGGGSGVKNNTSPPGSADGGAGGGIILVRTGSVDRGSGVPTVAIFNANGAPGHDGNNNGGGGGGAGGSVILTALTSAWTGVTVNAKGGDGGPAGTGTNQYGPGGGGGGGVVMASGTGAVVDTSGGANGLTNGSSLGAQTGTLGSPAPGIGSNTFVPPSGIPGAHSGAECNTFTAVDDLYATPLNVTLTVPAPGVLGNDSKPSGGVYTAVLNTTTSSGTLTLLATGGFTYIPNSGFTGLETFTYHVHDSTVPRDSNIATVTINVGGNVPPTAIDHSYSVNEDATLTVNAALGVLQGASDPNGNPLTAVLDSGPTNPALGATLTLNPDGSFTYTPTPLTFGTDTFTYHADDGQGGTSTVRTATITVVHVNHTPVANPNSYTVLPNVATTINAPGVLGNDTDADGDSLTAILDVAPTNGVVVLNSDGSFTYTPTPLYTGPDSFTYHVNDGTVDSNITTVSITVRPDNPPVAVADAYSGVQDSPLVAAAPGVLSNDTDPDADPLTAVLVTGTSNGTISLLADGSFTYTPNPGFSGTDSFTYNANDGTLSSVAPATVTLTVNALAGLGLKKHPAGYCGSVALEMMAPLGILWLYRRRRASAAKPRVG